MEKHTLTVYKQQQSPAAQMWLQLHCNLKVLREVWKSALQTNPIAEKSSYFPTATSVTTADLRKAS